MNEMSEAWKLEKGGKRNDQTTVLQYSFGIALCKGENERPNRKKPFAAGNDPIKTGAVEK